MTIKRSAVRSRDAIARRKPSLPRYLDREYPLIGADIRITAREASPICSEGFSALSTASDVSAAVSAKTRSEAAAPNGTADQPVFKLFFNLSLDFSIKKASE